MSPYGNGNLSVMPLQEFVLDGFGGGPQIQALLFALFLVLYLVDVLGNLTMTRGDRDLGVAIQTHPGRQAFVSSGSKEPRSALELRRVSLGAHWVDSSCPPCLPPAQHVSTLQPPGCPAVRDGRPQPRCALGGGGWGPQVSGPLLGLRVLPRGGEEAAALS